MYLSQLTVENFRVFGEGPDRLCLPLRPGLTALVGENDSGKSAVIDALRHALGTTDQEWYPLGESDLHGGDSSKDIKVICKFQCLTDAEKRAFLEFLTVSPDPEEQPVLYVHWTAHYVGEKNARSQWHVEVRSGKAGDGPALPPEARLLLQATYLRPLRDAGQALSAGRGSRLSQVLRQTEKVRGLGVPFNPGAPDSDPGRLSLIGIGDFANHLIQKHAGVVDARDRIDDHLRSLALAGEVIGSQIRVGNDSASEDVRLRQLLEKIDLSLRGLGRLGLGSDNLLFIACELLLLAQQGVGSRLLMVEEPEAHLHPQRQVQLMKYVQEHATAQGLQVLVTTHSPNLASAIRLDNLVILRRGRAFPLARGQTNLDESDYRFLERFLDVTKANLFFARGVVIVEGDAENILLPTLAKLIDRDFTEHGVSIVNVGGVGLHRYARVFQRKNQQKAGLLDIPVACLADMDVMPDCAPQILGLLKEGDEWPQQKNRRWRAKRDLGGEDALREHRDRKISRATGQSVRTFVSDEWTLEYDLAFGRKDDAAGVTNGLAEEVYIAACLAEEDEAICTGKKNVDELAEQARKEYVSLDASISEGHPVARRERLASLVYAKFARDRVSKAVAAQYLADRLTAGHATGKITPRALSACLPQYVTEAIGFVTRPTDPDGALETKEAIASG